MRVPTLLLLCAGCSSPGANDAGVTDPPDASLPDAASSDAATLDAAGPPDGGRPIDGGRAGDAPDGPGRYEVTRTSTTAATATYVAFVPTLPAGARAPLVLLKHGFMLSSANYATTAERVASHGFVVVAVDTGGGGFSGPTNVEERDATIAALDWSIADAPFAAAVDAERVAVLGHSRGGKVAVMVAAADARIDAALLMDPVNGCGPGTPYSPDCPDVTSPAIAGAISVAVGVMGETNNASDGFMPCAPQDQNYATIFDALTMSSWAVEWTFTGADHMDFTDDGGGFAGSFCPDGPGDDDAIRSEVRAMAVAFVRRHLLGDAAADAWLVGDFVPSDVVREGP